jgi:hypothetical protein
MKRLVQMWSAIVLFVGLVACGTDTPPLSSFNVVLNPESLSVAQGQSGTVSVTIDKTNFTAPIDLSVESADGTALPTGITATPTTSAAGTAFQISVASTVAVKDYSLRVKAIGGNITQTKPLFLTVTAAVASDLTLEINPSDLQVTQGQAGTVAVTLTRTNLTGDAAISLQGVGGAALPAGIGSTGATVATTTGSIVINVALGVAAQTYPLEVKAVVGSVTKTKALNLKVVAPAASEFTLSVNPVTLSLEQAKSGTATVNFTRTNFTSDLVVSLQSQGGTALPAGITAANITVSSSTGTLSIAVDAAVVAKPYSLEVKAVGGGLTKTTPFNLTVTAKPVTPDFTLAINPTSLSVEQAKSGNVTATLTRTNLTSTIDISLQGVAGAALPTGITFGFAPTATGGTLSINVAATVAAQPYNLEVKAVGGGLTKTQAVTLTVTTKPTAADLTLSINPSALTVEQTRSGNVVATLARTGFTGDVVLSLQGAGGAALPAGISAANVTTATNTGTLVIVVGSGAAVQDHSLEVKAVGGGVTKTAQLTLSVQPAPFAINQATQTILQWVGGAGDFLSSTSDNPTVANYQTTVSAAGVVTYDLPIPTVLSAPSSLLATYCSAATVANLTFNPPTVTGTQRLFGGQTPGKTGSLVLSSADVATPVAGLEQAFVVYVNGDLSIGGSCTGVNGATYEVAVNAQLKSGWNILVGTVTKVTNSTLGAIVNVSLSSRTTVPSRYAWRYYQR